MALRWSWIDFAGRTITIPGTVTKNGRTHTFPFGAATEAILRSVPEAGEFLFPASREHVRGKPTSVFNGCDAAADVSEYRLHDLRRTFATGLAALGTPVQVTERLLNHISGTQAGTVGIYQRHTYAHEMRAAIEAWERHVKLRRVRRAPCGCRRPQAPHLRWCWGVLPFRRPRRWPWAWR